MIAITFHMCGSGKLVFIIDSKTVPWAFICLRYFALGCGGWPECLEVSRCRGSGAPSWLSNQTGCFRDLGRALGLDSSFWVQNPAPSPTLCMTLDKCQLVFLSAVSSSAKGRNWCSWNFIVKEFTVCKGNLDYSALHLYITFTRDWVHLQWITLQVLTALVFPMCCTHDLGFREPSRPSCSSLFMYW